ncbi:MAG TPA: BMP family ABC transporter substrate-binding protein [Candidatus Izemoplasmatales bacterium]|nr:BMP family ABC transporter substrate-binding protein [Candidatus Izemoplasmatales bacterium]
MKKVLGFLLIALVSFGALIGCGKDEETYEIALITDVGNIDDKSFNEGAWNGVKQFAENCNISYAYYRPSEDSTAARVETIQNAIAKGATVVVCPGYLFEEAIYNVESTYPEVDFLLLDGEPHNADYSTYLTTSNVHCILYQEEQAGYLAGYAAVMDGYTELGFVGGMAVPAVVRYGYGYVQGADAAAQEKNVNINIKYYYADAFVGSDALEAKMDGWYAAGTEIVFACGGKLYTSVVAAAENAEKKVIGVDVDQYFVSDVIVTSAMKGLTVSVVDSLVALYNNSVYTSEGVSREWPEGFAGVTSTLGAAVDGIGLPTADTSWGFSTFTVAEYEVLYAKLVAGTIVVSNVTTVAPTVSSHTTVDYSA